MTICARAEVAAPSWCRWAAGATVAATPCSPCRGVGCPNTAYLLGSLPPCSWCCGDMLARAWPSGRVVIFVVTSSGGALLFACRANWSCAFAKSS